MLGILVEELKSTAEQLGQFYWWAGSGVPHYRQLDTSNYSISWQHFFAIVYLVWPQRLRWTFILSNSALGPLNPFLLAVLEGQANYGFTLDVTNNSNGVGVSLADGVASEDLHTELNGKLLQKGGVSDIRRVGGAH